MFWDECRRRKKNLYALKIFSRISRILKKKK